MKTTSFGLPQHYTTNRKSYIQGKVLGKLLDSTSAGFFCVTVRSLITQQIACLTKVISENKQSETHENSVLAPGGEEKTEPSKTNDVSINLKKRLQ